ncbi:MAG: ABC transporter substrate-binding protein [Firmicutes bacterium]|nr:ABC transporter substrate-binding protein [Bacillota bacterium]
MKKAIKRGIVFALICCIAVAFTACGGKNGSGNIFKIGVLQLATHDALDAAYQGFVDGLQEAGLKMDVDFSIDYQNAQGEKSNCQTIAAKFVNDKVDLVLAIATPAAQAMASETNKIPILVTAVTDPADSKLVLSNSKSGTNVAGTSDLTPVKDQLKLLKEIFPKAENVAVLYNSGEPNSVFQMKLAKEAAPDFGLTVIDASVSQSSEIQSVVESVVGKADVLYAPTDNMVASGMATVSLIAKEAKIPVIVGEEGMLNNGGLATYGINYYDLGKLTSTQAVEVIRNDAKVADMPILYLTDFELLINKKVADDLKIEIPKSLLDKAKLVEE